MFNSYTNFFGIFPFQKFQQRNQISKKCYMYQKKYPKWTKPSLSGLNAYKSLVNSAEKSPEKSPEKRWFACQRRTFLYDKPLPGVQNFATRTNKGSINIPTAGQHGETKGYRTKRRRGQKIFAEVELENVTEARTEITARPAYARRPI